uniref:C2H2-type domain-containing protein n=1 Tax=Timema shepardi TaxID=629360 RepID=A0A7R9B782_TIMSH|nr:unnamed protein product [Timema shepardi]
MDSIQNCFLLHSPGIHTNFCVVKSRKISLGDGLPSQICKTCAQELDVSFHFRRKCENSDVSLRRLLGKCEIDSEEDDLLGGVGDTIKVELFETGSTHEQDSSGEEENSCPDYDQANDTEFHEETYSSEEPKGRKKRSRKHDRGGRKRSANKVHRCSECQKVFSQFPLRQQMNNHRFDTNHKDPDKPVPIYAGTHNQDFQTCYNTKILRAFPKQCNNSQLRQWELGPPMDYQIKITTRPQQKIVHSKEKPYHCPLCPKVFAYRKTLKIHMNIHTGEKPHCCDICSKCFSERSHLKRHMKIHTNL